MAEDKHEDKPEQMALVCVRRGGLVYLKGQLFGRLCHHCGNEVVIAPSGQALLTEYPHVKIVCIDCLPDRTGEVSSYAVAPGAFEEFMQTAMPDIVKTAIKRAKNAQNN